MNVVKAVGTCATLVGVYAFWKNWGVKSNNHPIRSTESEDVRRLKAQAAQIRHRMEETRQQDLLEDQMINTQFEEIMRNNKANHEKQLLKMRSSFKEDEMTFLKKQQAANERIEQLVAQRESEQKVKDQMAHFENMRLKQETKRSLEKMDEDLERSRELHRIKIAKINNQFMQNKKDFAEQDANRKLEILAQEERAQERLREIEDQLARDLEELRRCDQQRRQEMNEQMENIRRLLQMKIWNDVIESNWTKRLNSLRSSNKDVERAYNQIRRSSKNYHETHAKHLLLAVVNQKSIMDNEKYEMEKLHAEHEKPFLLEIKGAVEEVSAECDRLSYVLQNEPGNAKRIEDCYSVLLQATNAIPTMAELKNVQ
ncbi:Protein containing ALS2cr12 (ALS2CR12) signature [Caenorhabditis elegans]|nr:Protein containing ALS2cr12 (ALS2CR12) signature [Caenorhabditis elegans]CCM09384.1 Protein containing ALS2cr12 (ALS2CR12) signature [Caenorhabditis elegans]|eukprot:NP_001263872.1 Protein containing ALS2cr12 (ALS2CR12) signature [Caenorhabditis elegans]